MKKAPLRTKLPKHLQTVSKINFCTYRKYRTTFFQPDTLLQKCNHIIDHKPAPKYWDWTAEDVAKWVAEDLGHPELKETFLQNNIDGKSLILLEADKFPKLNIKQFHIIKELTSNIRKLYKLDKNEFDKSISLLPRAPETLYQLFKAINTGPTAFFTTPSKFFRRANIIRDEVTDLWKFYLIQNHWNRIPPYMPWCPHVIIGGKPKINVMAGCKQKCSSITKPPYLVKNLTIYKLPRRKSLVLSRNKKASIASGQ